LDLEEVKLVDRDAVRFLADCEGNGIELCECSPYIRDWIARERAGRGLSKQAADGPASSLGD